jgi:hypothetical protein
MKRMNEREDKITEELYYIGYVDVSSYSIGPKSSCIQWFCEQTGTQMESRENDDVENGDTVTLMVKKPGGRWRTYGSGVTAEAACEEYFDEELSQDSRFVCGRLEDNIVYLVDPLSILERMTALEVLVNKLDLDDMAKVRDVYKKEIRPKRATLIGMVQEMYDDTLRNVLLLELGASPLEGSFGDDFAAESLEWSLKENISLIADYNSILKRVPALDVHAKKLDLSDEKAVRKFYKEKMNPNREVLLEMVNEIQYDEPTRALLLGKLKKLETAKS